MVFVVITHNTHLPFVARLSLSLSPSLSLFLLYLLSQRIRQAADRAFEFHRVGRARRQLIEALAAADAESNADARRCGKYGFWHKNQQLVHGTVRAAAVAAVRDLGMIFLTLGIFLSLYRLWPFLKDLKGARVLSRPLSRIGRRVVRRHVNLILKDQREMAFVFCLGLLQLATFVSLPATMSDLPRCRSLRDVSRVQARHLAYSCNYFCEIFSLFLVWRTYKLGVKAVLYSLLAPPACIAESIRPYVDALLGVPQPDHAHLCRCGGSGGGGGGGDDHGGIPTATAALAEPLAMGEDVEEAWRHGRGGDGSGGTPTATSTFVPDVEWAAAAGAAAAEDEEEEPEQLLPYGGDKDEAVAAEDWVGYQEIADYEAAHPNYRYRTAAPSSSSRPVVDTPRVVRRDDNGVPIDDDDDDDDEDGNSPSVCGRLLLSSAAWFFMLTFAVLAATADDSGDATAVFSSPCVPTTIPVAVVVGLGFAATATKRGASRWVRRTRMHRLSIVWK